MKQIKQISQLTNVEQYNSHHNRSYFSKKGVILVEIAEELGFHILDLESNTDITESDYIQVKLTPKTKVKHLFKNTLFDE